VEVSNQSGVGVISQPAKLKDKVGEEPRDIKKTPEYRKFKALFKKVIKAPPMKIAAKIPPMDTR
jgi:hypothetical protein